MINKYHLYYCFIRNTKFNLVKKKDLKYFIQSTLCKFLVVGNYHYSTYLSKLINENNDRFIIFEKIQQNNIPVGIYTVTPIKNEYFKMD